MARKILLADDSVTAQNMGRKILTDAGYEVVTVNNGSAALKKVAEQKPDLIVLDVYMPGYSGLEVCQRLKENRETARIPILLTVGKLEPFKPEEARRVKADAYVVKPFEASELLTALTRLEDKIVPQASDSQKPGRFAKAIAAFEGGEKFGDSESGWKDRLRFPTGEKKLNPEAEPDIPAPSSHAFRDLARDEARKSAAAQPEFERPLPAGLPADITPEEIAAITAAAAQLSGKAAPAAESPAAVEEKTSVAEPFAEASAAVAAPSQIEEVRTEQPAEVAVTPTESKPAEVAEMPAVSPVETAAHEEPAPVTLATATATSDAVAEPSAHEQSAVAEVAASVQQQANQEAIEPAEPAVEPSEPVVAEAKATEELQTPQESPKVEEKPKDDAVAAVDADVIAALETLKPSNGNGDAHLPESVVPVPTDAVAPPSMVAAVAAMEVPHTGVARWIAEPISVDADEASASLEAEMQKAFAAFAAADAARMSLPATAAISGSYVVPFIAEASSVAVAESQAETAAPSDSTSVANAETAPVVEVMPASNSAVMPAVETAEVSQSADVAAPQETAPSETDAVQPSPATSSETKSEPSSGGDDDMDRRDSHADALRAAAWANWHQIRDSIVGSTPAIPADEDKEVPVAATKEPEAMAAAASAGNSSSSVAEAGAIANIVDSVLAELRPKIVEEITKKLGNEKKNKK